MEPQSTEWRATVRRLNDAFRRQNQGRGSFLITDGVRDRGEAFFEAAIAAVRAFDAFTRDNDPYDEHDFGSFSLEGERLFFKIDYYDLALTAHTPDAADPAQTHRVLTLMLAEEY